MKLFIFGSTGDLVRKKVLPALQDLEKDELEIYALGRRDFTKKIYEDFVCKGNCKESFKEKIHYKKIDYNSEGFCDSCIPDLDKDKTNYFFIAMPPGLYGNIIRSIGRIKSKGYDLRILLEKPFGSSLKEAKEIKRIISENNLEYFYHIYIAYFT